MKRPERRRWKRQWFNGPVRLITEDDAHIDGLGISVSPGGMHLFAITQLPVGKQVTLEYHPPHSRQRVSVTGTVRYRTVYLYGVEFDSPSADSDTTARAQT